MATTRKFIIGLLSLLAMGAGAAEEWVKREVVPGLEYWSMRRDDEPNEIRVIRLARGNPSLRVEASVGATLAGNDTIDGFLAAAQGQKGRVVAAVNGDFYHMDHRPNPGLVHGTAVVGGRLVAASRERPIALAMSRDGGLFIGRLVFRGSIRAGEKNIPFTALNRTESEDVVGLYTEDWGWPLELPGLRIRLDGALASQGTCKGEVLGAFAKGGQVAKGEAVITGLPQALEGTLEISTRFEGVDQPLQWCCGGDRVLLRDGQDPSPGNLGDKKRHPRTMAGFTAEHLYFVTVDGRRDGWSRGMTSMEEMELMRELGCDQAINLDGGGSTVAWVDGKTVNRPSDAKPRNFANALLIFHEDGKE